MKTAKTAMAVAKAGWPMQEQTVKIAARARKKANALPMRGFPYARIEGSKQPAAGFRFAGCLPFLSRSHQLPAGAGGLLTETQAAGAGRFVPDGLDLEPFCS